MSLNGDPLPPLNPLKETGTSGTVHSPSPILCSEKNMPSSEDYVSQLSRRRDIIKNRLASFVKSLVNFQNVTLTAKQAAELRLRQQTAQALLYEFNTVQNSLEEYTLESDDFDERDDFESAYYSALADCEVILHSVQKEEPKPSGNKGFKLPTINLPKFEGNYDNWLEFRDTYLSMIHNSNQLDTIQKFHYLRAALGGSALQVIKSLEFSDKNYDIAWGLMESRYNNHKLLIHSYIKGLFTLNAIAKECPSEIRNLIDSVSKRLRALKSLGEPTESWDSIIIYMVLTKVDSNTEKEWEQFKTNTGNSKKQITLEELLNFLRDKADMLEMITANSSSHQQNNANSKPHHAINAKKPFSKSHSYLSPQHHNNMRARNCVLCNGNHSLYACGTFLALPPKARLDRVLEKKLCNNCLRASHDTDSCYFGPCRKCNKKHNSLLHEVCNLDSTSKTVLARTIEPETSTACHATAQTFNVNNPSVSCLRTNTLEAVLLSTALVEVKGNHNQYFTARTLLDNGSQHCIIKKSFSDQLKASYLQSTYQIAGIGNSVTQSSKTCTIEIRSLTKDYTKQITCLVLPYITSSLPSTNISNFNIP